MADRNGKSGYDDVLDQARDLIRDADSAGEEYSLEEILAEYGGGTERQLLRDAVPEETAPEETVPAEPEGEPAAEDTVPLPELKPARKAPEPPRKPSPPPKKEPEIPPPPRPLTMEEMVGRTVDQVMEEQAAAAPAKPRRWLFSRRPVEETEELPPPPEPEEEEPEEEPIGPEPPLDEAASEARRAEKKRREMLPAAWCVTALLAGLLAADSRGVEIPAWTGDTRLQTIVFLAALALVNLCCRGVFARGFRLLARRRCSAELVTSLAALVTAGDCAAGLLLPGRTAAQPYALPVCAALCCAQWGLVLREKGLYDAYRAAAITTEPPYLVTDLPQGTGKQRGRVEGFYQDSVADDLSQKWQTALLPVILVGTLVFGGLTSLGKGRGADFLLCWSAVLAASASLALPLSWSLPWSRLSAQLQKSGCALAGWGGAAAISRRRTMVLTDLDLFPPGSVQLNGIKVYGEKVPHAVSYAASLVRAAGSGLERLFDELLRSEGGHYRELSDFSFYEEGGCSAVIRGESVLLGTAPFLRKMDVRLPGNLNLQTGLYLAVDRQLVAVFAVKYKPPENVDWALRMLRRSRITPILASRDPNITPALLKRKFSRAVKVEYPPLAARLALSELEQGRGRPRALLLREGLLPYAETVAGAHRLRRGVSLCTQLSLLGSGAGMLLAYYLCSAEALALMTPLMLLAFQLLWLLPVVLLTAWTVRY
ncbi:hypothetical protein [Dysosmobacter sp.]|uniref:hypothetical protein n=1 Tax=Dysosmobacter sp. TaxID=2591382 RepID=UPI002A84E0D7|nr:hypothetical protein [Dysosmobacter sp.]MDY3281962.1 hypothetical protein [Dysosmobacter sp.]